MFSLKDIKDLAKVLGEVVSSRANSQCSALQYSLRSPIKPSFPKKTERASNEAHSGEGGFNSKAKQSVERRPAFRIETTTMQYIHVG